MYRIKTHIDSNSKLADLIIKNPDILDILDLLDIPLGFGEMNIKQIAEKYQLEYYAFEIMMKVYCGETKSVILEKKSLNTLLTFLRHSHNIFKNKEIPYIRTLIDKFSVNIQDKQGEMLVNFYEGYVTEIYEHFEYEDETVFPYIKSILDGGDINQKHFKIWEFEENHTDIEQKLLDLRNILIKYIIAETDTNYRKKILKALVNLERSIYYHTIIEDEILIPSVKVLEQQSNNLK